MSHPADILFQIYDADAANVLGIDQRNQAFWKTLQKYVPRPIGPRSSEPYLILDVACGECEEARMLTSYFSTGAPGISGRNVKLIGVDLDREALERALALIQVPLSSDLSPRFVLLPPFQFVCADATQLASYAELPDAFDFALIRHQFARVDSDYSMNVWTQIFQQTLRKLKSGGLLLSTSFTKSENQMLLEKLPHFDAGLLVNEKNPFSIPYGSAYPDVEFDQFVTLLRRH